MSRLFARASSSATSAAADRGHVRTPPATVTSQAPRSWARMPRSRRAAYRIRVWRRVAAATLVGVALWVTTERLRPTPPTPSRLVVLAAHDLSAGTTLSETDLTLGELGVGSARIEGLDSVSKAVGRVLSSPVSAGEVLSRSRFQGREALTGMPSGHLAVAIPVANPPIVAALSTGDRVTLVGTGDGATIEAVVLAAEHGSSGGSSTALVTSPLTGAGAMGQGGAGALIVAVAAPEVRVVAQEWGRAGASAGFVVALHGR